MAAKCSMSHRHMQNHQKLFGLRSLFRAAHLWKLPSECGAPFFQAAVEDEVVGPRGRGTDISPSTISGVIDELLNALLILIATSSSSWHLRLHALVCSFFYMLHLWLSRSYHVLNVAVTQQILSKHTGIFSMHTLRLMARG